MNMLRTLPITVLVIAIAACGGEKPKHIVSGVVQLADRDSIWEVGERCAGRGGYDDIRAGTQVTVIDGEGAIIATGELKRGRAVKDTPSSSFTNACEFSLEVTDVPETDFYSIEVSHRGALTYTLEEMEAMDWEVGFSLGN